MNVREGLIKKIEKKVGNFQLSVFDPPPPMKVGKKNFFDFLSAIDLLTYLEYIWIFPLEKLKKLRIFPPIHQFPTWRGGTTVHSHEAGGERGGGVLKLEKNFFAFLDVLDHLEAKKNEKKKVGK